MQRICTLFLTKIVITVILDQPVIFYQFEYDSIHIYPVRVLEIPGTDQ